MSESSKSYQQMLEKVETIVQDISTNEIDLDQMVQKVEEGYQLIQTMRERLNTTKDRIEELHRKFDEQDPSSS
jgi:exodeoxyribonuclease VII small subunit